MKEELQGKLVEILSSIQQATGKASDFAISQLPDIAQSYITYARISSVVFFILFFSISFLLGFIAWYAYKKPWNSSEYSWESRKKRSDSNYLVMFMSLASSIIFMIIAFVKLNLMVWFAPKVWLIKEIATLIK